MERIVELKFTEKSSFLVFEQMIKTDLDDEQINQLITAIANVKAHADWGESLSDFEIPENWNVLSFFNKITVVVQHMETILPFSIIHPEYEAKIEIE